MLVNSYHREGPLVSTAGCASDLFVVCSFQFGLTTGISLCLLLFATLLLSCLRLILLLCLLLLVLLFLCLAATRSTVAHDQPKRAQHGLRISTLSRMAQQHDMGADFRETDVCLKGSSDGEGLACSRACFSAASCAGSGGFRIGPSISCRSAALSDRSSLAACVAAASTARAASAFRPASCSASCSCSS